MVTTLITSPFALVTSLDSFTTPVTRLGGGNHPGYHPGERAVYHLLYTLQYCTVNNNTTVRLGSRV
jgi:hypothetical protein